MTRMWLLKPALMCQQHRLGEHNELHKLAGGIKTALNDNHQMRATITGQARDANIDVRRLVDRHAKLEQHDGWDSPLPWRPSDTPTADLSFAEGDINIIQNEQDLADRCPACRSLLSDTEVVV